MALSPCLPAPVVLSAASGDAAASYAAGAADAPVGSPAFAAEDAGVAQAGGGSGGMSGLPSEQTLDATVDELLLLTTASFGGSAIPTPFVGSPSPTPDQASASEEEVENFFAALQVKPPSLLRTPMAITPAPRLGAGKMPIRSKRIAAQKLAHVPVAKRGEVIVMQRLGFANEAASLTASALKKYNDVYQSTLETNHFEAIFELFPPAVRWSQPRCGTSVIG
ncbi:hypothetical protein BS78_01G132200 [Paspalum vaginatum]|nr:hypothetical protein BS78_01G132200 [Paspalum vaginatum]